MITQSNSMNELSQILKLTLAVDKQQRKQAEQYLESVEGTETYGILLLQLLDTDGVDAVVRTAAAVTFKNFVKRNWRIVEGEPSKISENDRTVIKQSIVELMLKSPESLQKQLSDSISIIGREDFPTKWQDLIGKLTMHMKVGDGNYSNLNVVNGVLHTAHSLFKRFRYEFKSQELWTELKFVLDQFASPLLNLYEELVERIPAELSHAAVLKPVFEILTLICKLFYSLNYQEFPEFFEDNMKRWMEPFLMLLTSDFKVLETDDKDEAGPLERIRSQICDNISLYAQKYDEDFQPYLPNFVSAVWNLLTTTGQDLKYDLLVSNAIQFLASVCERPHYKDLFGDPSTLQGICEKVIVPNMIFRDADEELFEDNPEEYIRKDIEGSDIDTRRRAACDLVRGLCKYFEQAVIGIFSQYVSAMLQQYAHDRQGQWKSKDAAIYLVTSLAAKKSTAKHGTTEASELVNLNDFFATHILPDLQSSDVDDQPVLKADAIKYVITFRSVLPRGTLLGCVPCLAGLLRSKSNVVHSYAANAVEKLLMVRKPGGGAPFSTVDLAHIKDVLLQNLFAALTLPGSAENEYVMKAIMRCLMVLQEGLLAHAEGIIGQLSAKLAVVCKNPSKPQFNHYLFEAICALLRGVGKEDKALVSKLEAALFPVFQVILQEDVTEFLPYVFQVLSLALEIRVDGVHGPYMQLFPLLLQPVLWERQGNIPALTRLLQAYVKRGGAEIISSGKLLGLLGVFQKLIASRAHDHEGFYLLSAMVEHMPWSGLEPHFKQVFVILFQRLQTSKTTKYVKGYLVFVSLFAGKQSPVILQQLVDSIQPKLFGMMVEKLFVPDLQKISGPTERKICAVGVTKLLTEVPSFLDDADYVSKWSSLLQALIGLFELPEDDSVPDDEHFIDVEDTPGYQTAFSQLAFASKKEADPYPTIPDAKEYLAKQLYRLSVQRKGKLPTLISQGLDPGASKFLQSYLSSAQVQLS